MATEPREAATQPENEQLTEADESMAIVFSQLSQQIGDAAVREAQLQSVIARQSKTIEGLKKELLGKNNPDASPTGE